MLTRARAATESLCLLNDCGSNYVLLFRLFLFNKDTDSRPIIERLLSAEWARFKYENGYPGHVRVSSKYQRGIKVRIRDVRV